MFYEPKDGHGLPHNPFNAIITPRPIAWVSTVSKDGVRNLAPYSFFNGTAYFPPQVMFATTSDKDDQGPGLGKDSLANIRETGVFCINIVEVAMTDAMNISTTGFAKEVDEFERAGLTPVQCETIDCPRIEGAPAALECVLTDIHQIRGDANYVTFGEVTGIHLRDDCMVDGKFDVTTFQPLARMGYRDYSKVEKVFTLARPDD